MHRGEPTSDTTARFSDRVRDYVRFRPDYPRGLLNLLTELGLCPGHPVADVGAGTGIFTAQLLDAGAEVYAVEPNDAMRSAAEAWLGQRDGFHSVSGTAEATGLPDDCVDLVTVAQAFHWFRPEATRTEFKRILRRGGVVVLIWNSRLEDSTPFLREYEQLLQRYGTDYGRVSHRRIDPLRIGDFFGKEVDRHSFPHHQELDRDGLRGRLLSSSYTPREGEPARIPMLRELDEIFHRHQQDGRVRIDYETEAYVGWLD